MFETLEYPVLNVKVHLFDEYKQWLINRLENKLSTHVITLNAEMAMLAENQPELANLINKVELVIPDGAGIILYLSLRGTKQQRCPGIDLAASLLAELGKLEKSCPICFYGGEPGIAQQAAQFWRKKVPGIDIMTNHGYLSPEEEVQWQKTLQEKQPRLVLVALGAPRQGFWIDNHRHLCPHAIWIGVGGSFDIWAGKKSLAPEWFRNNNLEWLYRLYQEPWRWRRMLALPQFLWRSLSTILYN